MDALIAFLFMTAPAGEPVLAGGPAAPISQPGHRSDARVETHHPRAAHHLGESHPRSHRHGVHDARDPVGGPATLPVRSHGSVRAGDRVRLGADFFAAPGAGGVERAAPARVYGRRGVIVIAPAGPVSAGQAAAARGLPRG